jgi:acyl carrier protein
MIPAAFVDMERLPLTANGKLDRRALPEPEPVVQSANFVPPSSPTERSLAEIWCEVLNIGEVSIHDNFLAIGGHSLTATRIISRVRDKFQIELPLRRIFELPTIAELAHAVDAAPALPPSPLAAAHLITPQQDTDLDQLLDQLARLSDEEAAAIGMDGSAEERFKRTAGAFV